MMRPTNMLKRQNKFEKIWVDKLRKKLEMSTSYYQEHIKKKKNSEKDDPLKVKHVIINQMDYGYLLT